MPNQNTKMFLPSPAHVIITFFGVLSLFPEWIMNTFGPVDPSSGGIINLFLIPLIFIVWILWLISSIQEIRRFRRENYISAVSLLVLFATNFFVWLPLWYLPNLVEFIV